MSENRGVCDYEKTLELMHAEQQKLLRELDEAKDGSIEICDLPDLVAEWRSPERKDAELMKEINAAFDKAAEGLELSSEEKNKESWLRTATGWYDARFRKVE